MNIIATLKISKQALLAHKSRTILTVLGIVIGITAVIMVFAAGAGLKSLVLAQLDSFGSNLIQTEVKVPKTKKNSSENAAALASGVTITTLTLADAEAMKKIPNVVDNYGAIMTQAQVVYDGNRRRVNIFGASASLAGIDTSKIDHGRFYTVEEEKGLARVAVVGSDIQDKLFDGTDPVGKYVKINNVNFQVIGVLAKRGAVFFMNLDDQIYLPVTAAQKLLMGVDYISFITTKVSDPARTNETVADIEDLLRSRHRITDPTKDDFAVTSMAETQDMLNTILGGLTLLLSAIAAISLIVGGVGIMNIMYVSVTERVFEIGLRKSVGAKQQDILIQFLTEAVLVTLLGGLIGIALGVGFSFLIATIAQSQGFNWGFSVPIASILLALGVSTAIGLLFGFLPAQKAAKLDPIVALQKD